MSANATLIEAIRADDNAHLLLGSDDHVDGLTSKEVWPALVEISSVIADLGRWCNVSIVDHVESVCARVNASMIDAVRRLTIPCGSTVVVPPDAVGLEDVKYVPLASR